MIKIQSREIYISAVFDFIKESSMSGYGSMHQRVMYKLYLLKVSLPSYYLTTKPRTTIKDVAILEKFTMLNTSLLWFTRSVVDVVRTQVKG